MDLNPINQGHVLVVPNHHHGRVRTIDDDCLAEMFQLAKRILNAIENSEIQCEGANLFLSDGAVAGQEVPHSHLHIVPRFEGDGHRMGFSGVDSESLGRQQLDEVAAILFDHLEV